VAVSEMTRAFVWTHVDEITSALGDFVRRHTGSDLFSLCSGWLRGSGGHYMVPAGAAGCFWLRLQFSPGQSGLVCKLFGTRDIVTSGLVSSTFASFPPA
jgi:hypothetical protein